MRLVERAIAAINARDIEGYLACCTENVKLETPMAAVGGVYEGIGGIGRFFTDIQEAAPDFLIELDGVQEVDSKRVIAFMRASSTGRASGIRMAADQANVYDLVDGKISHIRIFVDRVEALTAVGLEELPVPQENVDLVRSIYADWERGDWGSTRWAHPDIEYVMVEEPAGSTTHRGRTAMGEAWRAFLGAWVDYRLEPQEFRTLDHERVLVRVKAYGHGKASGVELSDATPGRAGANLFHIFGGMVVRLDAYFDWHHALADLGLEE